uniref:NADH-ubiquinone oxidoreductase chain 6 n=1 Tax=Chiropsalmus quadrumanus TaxID=645347 RepID=G9IT43_9CNID|nr:NADH dehydrogenase subunit 6 [Chiropsalmus quadrumanus]
MVEAGVFTVILLSSVGVISSFNPVSSVVWLVLAFISSSFLFWTNSCGFLGMLLILVYVGAIAVLFVFVIMMLPTVLSPKKPDVTKFVPLILGVVVLVIMGASVLPSVITYDVRAYTLEISSWEVVECLSLSLYGSFISLLFIAGLVLLVALVTSLVLCVTPGVIRSEAPRKQDSFEQLSR